MNEKKDMHMLHYAREGDAKTRCGLDAGSVSFSVPKAPETVELQSIGCPDCFSLGKPVRTTKWVLVRVAGVPADFDVAALVRDKTLGEFGGMDPLPHAIDYTPLEGAPLTKGGMGAWQYCHDCKTWGVPGPFVESICEGHLKCACGSKNIVHYVSLLDRRDGEIQHGHDQIDLRSFDSVKGCSICHRKESGDRMTCFQPLMGLDYYLCAACLRNAAQGCDVWDKKRPQGDPGPDALEEALTAGYRMAEHEQLCTQCQGELETGPISSRLRYLCDRGREILSAWSQEKAE